jgi:hypothetical protein
MTPSNAQNCSAGNVLQYGGITPDPHRSPAMTTCGVAINVHRQVSPCVYHSDFSGLAKVWIELVIGRMMTSKAQRELLALMADWKLPPAWSSLKRFSTASLTLLPPPPPPPAPSCSLPLPPSYTTRIRTNCTISQGGEPENKTARESQVSDEC